MQPSKPTPPAPAHTAERLPNAHARRRAVVIAGSAATMSLVCAVTLWALNRPEQPRLNDDTVSLVKYVCTSDYAKLPFARQAEYMKVLEDRDDNDELKAAFEANQLTEGEYRSALLEAWLGQQVKRSEKYASLPPGVAREKYVRELVDKKEAKDARKAAKPKREKTAPDVKRDEAQEDLRINAWPAEVKTRWETYRRAYNAEKEKRESAAQPEGVAGAN